MILIEAVVLFLIFFVLWEKMILNLKIKFIIEMTSNGLITNTNIIVDNFSFAKKFQPQKFIHFLSHFHSDHYWGLTTSWSFGPLFCSDVTRTLLLNKFPNVPNVIALKLNLTHEIWLNESQTKFVKVTLLKANHIPGSVMFLFQGYFGNILHTGDIRYYKGMGLRILNVF